MGGDGTHRAVVSECDAVPIAGISTGTNNAFPEHREPTITGLATGLAVTGVVPKSVAFASNKKIEVSIDGGAPEVALVDVAIVTDCYIGARALWRTETFRELFVTFADPEVIGLAAIAGLIEPIARNEPAGMMPARAGRDRSYGGARADRAGSRRAYRHRGLAPDATGRPFAPSSPPARLRSTASEFVFDAHQSLAITLIDHAFRRSTSQQ